MLPIQSIYCHGSYGLVMLELTRDRQGMCHDVHFAIVNRLEKQTDPQIYNDILHMLEVNVVDDMKFQNTNWQKWVV